MFMHILTIDRLSRTFVVGGLIFVALGLVIAFLKSDRVHDTDGVTFWICAIVTIFGLVLVAWLTCNEANVRVAGLFFQVAGIVVALYALQDVRTKLDQPGLIAALTEFVEKPFKGQSINLTEEGAHLQGSASSTTEAHGTLTTHPKSLSTEDRFNALEDQAAKLEAMHAADIAAMRRTIQDSRQNELDRHREQVAAVKDVKQLVVELQTGGLPLALSGLIWLLIGTFLTSIPDVVADWIKHLHH